MTTRTTFDAKQNPPRGTILVNELSTCISVKIFEGGAFPRVRTASSRSHFRRIMSEEKTHFKELGVKVSVERPKVPSSSTNSLKPTARPHEGGLAAPGEVSAVNLQLTS